MIKCDANKLPEDIKAQAKDYCANVLEHDYADTREELEEDVMRAWLAGFSFCMEGKVNVLIDNLEREVRGVIHILENCPKNELALQRAIERVKALME
jgi:hypothetical protein